MTEHKTNGVAGPAVPAATHKHTSGRARCACGEIHMVDLPEREPHPPHYVAPPAPPLPPAPPAPEPAPHPRVKSANPAQRFLVTAETGRQFVMYGEDDGDVRRKLDANMTAEITQGLGVTTLGAVRGKETIQLDNVVTNKTLNASRERQLAAGVTVCTEQDVSGIMCCDTPAVLGDVADRKCFAHRRRA